MNILTVFVHSPEFRIRTLILRVVVINKDYEMKKTFVLAVLFLLTAAVFGQQYTFQGLPWGSTREQVVAKLGRPNINTENRILYYNVVVAGWRFDSLEVQFNDRGG